MFKTSIKCRFSSKKNEIHFKDTLMQLSDRFADEKNKTIYAGRNVLKIIDHNNEKAVVKSFKELGLIRRCIYTFFRASKAQRSYEHSMMLKERNIGTPAPIAYINYYKAGFIKQSYYACDFIDYDFEFRDLNDQHFDNLDAILKACASFVTDLHKKEVLHTDLSLGNVLIKRDESNYLFYLVDVNRMRFGALTEDEKIHNLTRLLLKKDIRDIFCSYFARLNNIDEQALIKKVEKNVAAFYGFRDKKKALKNMLGLKK